MDRMPARTAFLIPSAPCACAITASPAASASSTSTASSAGRKCGCRGSSRGDSTPPLVATLSTSAPARTSVRTTRRTSSGPSQMPLGRPGVGGSSGVSAPHTCQSSACPPVWLIIASEICMRGPRTSPDRTASATPRSAPAASRTEVMPRARVRRRLRTASK